MKTSAQHTTNEVFFNWKETTALPDADGLAGSYAGVSNGALIMAGGTNFPGNKRPWADGVKTWYDTVWVLEKEGGAWQAAGKLPRPMGYGVSLTWKNSVLCIGGGDAARNYTDVFLLKYANGKIETATLPALPAPVINACGALLNGTVYIAGGIASPTGDTEHNFWSLHLEGGAKEWKILPALPGAARMLAMAGALDGKVYVFGGVELQQAKRKYLADCWVYEPAAGWKRVADLPHALAAAPSPAYPAGSSQLFLFGGDDGANATRVAELKDTHPGFSIRVLAYNTRTNAWSVTGAIPVKIKPDAAQNPHGSVYAPVTTPQVIWNNNIVLPGGEARPAVRSKKILIAVPPGM